MSTVPPEKEHYDQPLIEEDAFLRQEISAMKRTTAPSFRGRFGQSTYLEKKVLRSRGDPAGWLFYLDTASRAGTLLG